MQGIFRNVQQATEGTSQVTANIADVNHSAGETGAASGQVLSAAVPLSKSRQSKNGLCEFLVRRRLLCRSRVNGE